MASRWLTGRGFAVPVPRMVDRRRSLHYVTGKGGVGKSTVCAALALAAAARGQRVLAIELGQPGGLRRLLGVAPEPAGTIAPAPAAPGVAVTWFDGAAALGEYLVRRLRLGRLGRALIAHPIYQAFATAAPGVRELMVIGKVRDELVLQRIGARPRWDLIVVDAGASGHALAHLRMPAAAARSFPAGLVHREATRNAALLGDPATCAVHVVASPEELPLAEAAQVVMALRTLGLDGGALLVNQCRPAAPPEIDETVARLGELAVTPGLEAARDEVATAVRRARRWERIQERGVAALESELGVTAVRLPRLWHGEGLARAAALAPLVEEATR